MRSLLVLAPALVSLAHSARAQSFNIEFGVDTPLPASSYGGAAGQPGSWNTPLAFPHALVDVGGQPTAVTLDLTASSSFPDGAPLHPSFTGEADALMNDWITADNQAGALPVGQFDIHFEHLAPGSYEVFTYAFRPTSPCPTHVSVFGSVDPTGTPTGPGSNELALGATHTRHRVTTLDGKLDVQIVGTEICEPFLREAILNGMQIVALGGQASLLCAGDGTQAQCPCGNSGASGRGCASSFEPNGARLQATGVASVSADALVLSADGTSVSVVTFFQGRQTSQAGAGVAFGDGLRCASGATVRLASRFAAGGTASYPLAGDVPLAIRGGIDAAGGVRAYQVWYRDSAAFCTAATFNATNGVRVAWAP